MKLLLLSEFFSASEKGEISGGVEARNFYLAKYFKGEIIVFASKNNKFDAETYVFTAKVKRAGFSYKYSQNTSLLKRIIFAFSCIFHSSKNFDVVEGTNFITHFAAIIIGFIRKRKVVLWYPDVWLGSWFINLGFAGIFGEILERFVLFFGRNAKFIAISESTKNKLIRQGINEKNISVVPCGVDEEEIISVRVSHGKPLQKMFDLVVVNRLVAYKNTDKIIKAISIFSRDRSRPVPTTLIIGYGPEKQNLEKLISRYDLQDKITIISSISSHEKLLTTIATGKIFVSVSSVEGFDIAALEAASLGLPCVLFDIPAHQEHEKNLQGCVLFKNEKDLKEKIDLLLRNNVLYEKLSKLNLENAKQYYWQKIINQTVFFYNSI